ncbi:aldehyde dehydrogenase family protein [Nocardia sp. CDC159]|uniref:Aldehyde dehydrogenase family protein n=1 Tax=Nocardia pulmonis TaxID=2951408 RepID=A0A9X2E2S1_9NOCA|nr:MULTISPECIES: aldehyde dehydrogenase family protein [Nocardia]MCM6772581.1 aldehyde dehydrogenase family protein [Nocardia pulmonis]MCM6784761.1 aldehyde dehydrogenase family protein [Nocardia sp. CDC159]
MSTTNLRTIEIRNPADGRTVGSVPDHDADAVADAVRALRSRQPEWEALGPRGRAKWLLRLQDWLIDNGAHLTDVIQSETGKTRFDAEIEAPAAIDLIKYWARNAEAFLTDEHPKPHSPIGRTKRLITTFRPHPVVGIITPWNLPLLNPCFDAFAALMAGAAVLVKPSEVTPLSAVALGRGWTEIGAPRVFTVLTGGGDTGRAVVDAVDYVQFTGSTKTGRAIAAACGTALTPYSLELGGKDPAIVLADADLERAAAGIVYGGLFNAGQACISVERVYVEAPVYDRFLALLTAEVRRLRHGRDGREFAFDIGALATRAQCEIVRRHVDDAVARGARILLGGKPTGVGTFFEPTILVDVDHTMSCLTEETFGPTLPVLKVADEDEAIRLANDSAYGLSATVWTGDRRRGERIARRLEVGAVNINDAFANLVNFAIPMGGWKQSGIGARWGGAAGIRKYCRQQAITVPRGPALKREPLWYPASRWRSRFVTTAMRAVDARGLRRLPLRRARPARRCTDYSTRQP